jgi:hypothetical protein
MTPGSARLRWVGLGLFLLQAAWFVAMPPFAAMDEWDHAYRAAAVAHGQWAATPSSATTGTGAVVSVPTDIVEAARYECRRLSYGGQDECVGSPVGDFSEVASGAGRYPPTFYAMVGWPSRFLDGAAALYGMRLVGLVMCWALFMASFRTLCRWAGPLAGLAVCAGLTPAVLYASAMAAPNGLEMASGVALWSALASLAHARDGRVTERSTVALAVVSGTLLLSLRAMGPFWMAMIIAVWLIAWPSAWPRLRQLMSSSRGRLAAGWLAAVACLSVSWILSQDTLEVRRAEEGTSSFLERLAVGIPETLLWTFQFLGTFPYRRNPAPTLVYACLLIVLVVGAAVVLRLATSRERWALAAMVGSAYAIPMVITVATLERYGTAWQGRYALPFLLGTVVVGGVVLRRAAPRRLWPTVAACGLLTAAHAAVVANTILIEHRLFVGTHTPLWALDVHPAVVGVLAAVGTLALTAPFVLALRAVINGDGPGQGARDAQSVPATRQSRPTENADSRSCRE